MDIYKESIKHIRQYKPIEEYVGAPLHVRWIRESSFTDDKLLIIVPFKGPKGSARLHIHGKKGSSNE